MRPLLTEKKRQIATATLNLRTWDSGHLIWKLLPSRLAATESNRNASYV